MISKQKEINMNEPKFTKGEWEVANGLLVGEQVLFIHAYPKQVICRLTKQVDTDPLTEEDVANAHLIKTSPKLYELLEEVYHVLHHDLTPTNKVYIKAISDLLSEARGEA